MGWEPYRPDAAVLEPARRIVRFFETGDVALLDGLFTEDAVLLESVSPYVYTGSAGIVEWAQRIADHVGDHVDLRGSLGEPHEFSTDLTTAFYSLPVTWRFRLGNQHVDELGAMVLLLRCTDDRWQVARYAWGVVDLRRD